MNSSPFNGTIFDGVPAPPVPAAGGPTPDPLRGTSVRLGPDPRTGTSVRLGPDPSRGTSVRL